MVEKDKLLRILDGEEAQQDLIGGA